MICCNSFCFMYVSRMNYFVFCTVPLLLHDDNSSLPKYLGGWGGGGWYDGSFKTTWLSLISTQLSSVEDDYDLAVIYIETKVQCNSISPN